MNGIDEKALETATEAFMGWGNYTGPNQRRHYMREAITAYLAALAPQQAAPMPGVEALEWSEGESRVTADCLTGRYILDGHKGRWTVSVPTASVSKGKGPAECERKAYPSLFAAKAAAQADYKQRILSALGSYNCFCTGYAAPSARKEP